MPDKQKLTPAYLRPLPKRLIIEDYINPDGPDGLPLSDSAKYRAALRAQSMTIARVRAKRCHKIS